MKIQMSCVLWLRKDKCFSKNDNEHLSHINNAESLLKENDKIIEILHCSIPTNIIDAIQRWSLILSNFDYTLSYIKGLINTGADALS